MYVNGEGTQPLLCVCIEGSLTQREQQRQQEEKEKSSGERRGCDARKRCAEAEGIQKFGGSFMQRRKEEVTFLRECAFEE
jgi:hypothetical protein